MNKFPLFPQKEKENLTHPKKQITIKHIAFICPYPFDTVGGQRFRFEQYLDVLTQKGLDYQIFPFLDQQTYSILYKKGNTLQKAVGLLFGIVRRMVLLTTIWQYQYVFIYREAIPIGPPIWEFIVAKLFKRPLIVDFDDAIWLPPKQSTNAWLKTLRFYPKLSFLCKWAYKVSCGNYFLAQYAQQYNPNTYLIPTTLDTTKQHNQTKQHTPKTPIIIGWTGSHTTLAYLTPFYPVLEQLSLRYQIEFRVIANQKPQTNLPFVRFIPWSSETEIADLLAFDIGVMPLTDTPWEQGKCGFKALQYMSLGIPAVVSPVGVNTAIIQHAQNGFVATTNQDWIIYLSQLIESVQLRTTIGRAGQITVQERFSKISQTSAFLQLFQ